MYDTGNSQLNTFKHCILLMYISIYTRDHFHRLHNKYDMRCLSYMDNVLQDYLSQSYTC